MFFNLRIIKKKILMAQFDQLDAYLVNVG